MFNEAGKVESATIVFISLQVLFLVVSTLAYYSLTYRVKHFDYGKLSIDESRIIDAVQLATKEFLHDYQTNIESRAEVRKPSLNISRAPGCVYSTLRTSGARIDGLDYRVGDYYKEGTNLWMIALMDFDGQRLYCMNDLGDQLVLQLTSSTNGDNEEFPSPDDSRGRDSRAAPRGGGGRERSERL